MVLIQSAEIHNANKYPEYVGYRLYDSGYDYVLFFYFNRTPDGDVRGANGTGVKHYESRQAAVNAGLRYMSRY